MTGNRPVGEMERLMAHQYDGRPHILHVRDAALHREFRRLCKLEGKITYLETAKMLRAWVVEHQRLEQDRLKAKRLREQREEELTSPFEARRAAVDAPDGGESALMHRPAFWSKPGKVKGPRTLQ